MALVLATFEPRLVTDDGSIYRARVCGRERSDRLWEGWVEFVPDDGSPVLRTGRETTQPNLRDLEYWATGLTAVYLEGALARTLSGPPQRRGAELLEMPAYEEPAADHAILDPYSVYAKGEHLLRQQLHALSAWHLRNIVRAYDLVSRGDVALETLTEAELVGLIVSAVRGRV